MSLDADNKVMFIFEACSSLGVGAELASLAARIYRQYLAKSTDMCRYDLYTVAAASIKLAHWFYELSLDMNELVIVLICTAHHPSAYADEGSLEVLVGSINLMASLICSNLAFEIDYKGIKRMTPGSVSAARHKKRLGTNNDNDDDDDDDESDNLMDVNDPYLLSDTLLSQNNKNQISSHRYLVHYLKSIKNLTEDAQESFFTKIANVAWTILSDLHWSPFVIYEKSSHIACACLMMAIEISKEDLDRDDHPSKKRLWQLMDKRWNLILCDDLPNNRLNIMIEKIVRQYSEFDNILQREIHVTIAT